KTSRRRCDLDMSKSSQTLRQEGRTTDSTLVRVGALGNETHAASVIGPSATSSTSPARRSAVPAKRAPPPRPDNRPPSQATKAAPLAIHSPPRASHWIQLSVEPSCPCHCPSRTASSKRQKPTSA